MADIDRLEVSVEAQAIKANNALDKLIRQLNSVSNSLSKVNASGLSGLSNGIAKLASASAQLSNVKTSDFTRLINNIGRLEKLNKTEIYSVSSAFNTMAHSINNMSATGANAQIFSELAKNISKLGNKSIQNAIDNMPKLATSITQLTTTLSKAPAVSDNIIKLINSLSKLSSQGNKVGTTTKSITNSLNQYSKSSSQATKKSISLSSAIGKLYQSYFWVYRIVKKVGDAIISSMDYIEEYNYYNVTLEKIGKEWSSQFEQYGYNNAESYMKSFESRMTELSAKMTGFNINANGTLTNTGLKSLGLDVTKMMNYQAGLAQVTNAQGLTGEASIATSKALSMLAGDMSSFRNTDLSTVMTNFQSGIIGQSRALYKYGIDITNATLQTYAYANGIDKAISEMTQGEKMQLRTLAILDQSKVAWGDLANTIESPSNQLRLLKNNFSALARTIGNIFLPIVAKVLPYINGLVIAIRRLFEWCGKMLGVDISGIIQNSGAGYSDAFDGIEEGADDAADGLDNAKNSAKELKNELMGFDEINKLSDTSDSSSSGSDASGAGTIDLTSQLNKALSDYEKVWNAAFDNMNNKANDFADNIVNAFKQGDFKAIGTYISTSLRDSLNDIDWDMVYSGTKQFWSGLADFLNGLIRPDTFKAVGATVAAELNVAIYSALTFGEEFNWSNLGTSLASGINGFLEDFDFGALADGIDAWIQGLAAAIIAFIKEFDWTNALKGAWDFLSNIDIETVGLVISGISFYVGAKVIATAVTTNLLPILAAWFSKYSGKFLKIGITVTIATVAFEIAKSELEPIFSEYDLEEIKQASDEMFKDWFGDNPISATLSDMFVFTATSIAEPSEIMDGLSLMWDDICSGDFKFNLFNLFEFPSYNQINDGLHATTESISDWWDNNIAIWFVSDTWEELWGYAYEDTKEGWENIKEWWKNNALSRWWRDDVAIWFNGDTWKELWGYVKEDFEDGWQNVKEWWKNNALSRWWNEHVSPYFSKEKWNLSGIREGLESAFNSAIDSIKGIWNGFATWINDALSIDFDGFSKSFKVMGKKIEIGIPAFSIDLGHLPTFAAGGFPEDGWFRASHGEMMGKFDNGQSVVANNNQITDGIAAAVYRGNQETNELLRQLINAVENNSDSSTNISIDGKTVFEVIKTQADNYTMRTGKAPFPI